MAGRGIYCKDGDFRPLLHVLLSEEDMARQPSLEDFASVVYKSSHAANPMLLYAIMCKLGLESCTSLANQIVCMLVDNDVFNQAQRVFKRLVLRSQCSWNSLITGYIKRGESQGAFSLYHKMQEDNVSYPNPPTVVLLLKFCGKLRDVERGMTIHVDLVRTGFIDRDLYVRSTLIDMYFMFGLIFKAREVFDKFTSRNVVLWTSLISGYAKLGFGEEAFSCYKDMQRAGFSPDSVAFLCTLKACSTIGAMKKGQQVHAEIERLGLLERDLVVGNTLIDMYAKCGWLGKSREVLDELPQRNVVSWTALISGCVDCGYGEEALQYLKEMQLEGVAPNAVTYACGLKACGSTYAIDEGCEIHTQIKGNGSLEDDPVVGCALLDMYAKCGWLLKAQNVFDKLLVRNAVSWNALIAGYADCGYLEHALSCLGRMRREGFSPDAVTYISMLKACGSARNIRKGSDLHAEIKQSGLLEQDPAVGSSLIDMYAQCGLLAKAREVFDSLPFHDVVIYNSLITGYVENGCEEEALHLFWKMQDRGIYPDTITFVCSLKACSGMKALKKGEEIYRDVLRQGNFRMDSMIGNSLVDMYAKCGSLVKSQEVFDGLKYRDIVSWNALIAGYVQHGEGEQALECFEQMQLKQMSPNTVTFILSLKACSSIGAMDKGQIIHAEIERKGLLQSDILVGTTLLDMYAKHGSMITAHEVFTHLPVQGVVSWNILLAGYASLGESEHVISLFERMLGEGIKASFVTFIIILNACSQTGLVDKGETYFKVMTKDYGVAPSLEHQICMVDLLGRAGRVGEAVSLIKKLPTCLGPSIWNSVLGACGKLGNAIIGNEIFSLARCLDETDPSVYALMSSIYITGDTSEETKEVQATKSAKDLPIFPQHFWWTSDNKMLVSPVFEVNEDPVQKLNIFSHFDPGGS